MKPLPASAFLAVIATVLALTACRPEPPPTEKKPEPQAQAANTELREAIQKPLQEAHAVQQSTEQAAKDQAAAIDAATQ